MMERWKRVLRWVIWGIHPPVWLAVLLVLLSAAGLTAAFTGVIPAAAQYISYALSAYTLCAVVALTWNFWPRLVRLFRENPVMREYRKDMDSRALYSVHLSLIINVAYAIFKGWAGIWYGSVWFGTLAFYYIVVALARSSLARSMRRGEGAGVQGWRRYIQTGWLILILTLAVGVMGMMMIFRQDRIAYKGYIIFVVALYAFYAVINAVRNILRYRKLRHPVYSASKSISLATALVTLFSMQTAMLNQFGSDEFFYRIMSCLTGGFVFLIVIFIAVYMIVHGRKMKRTAQPYG